MAHNPILKMRRLGRLDQVEVRLNTQGVLYIHNRFRRLIEPGGSLTLDERIGGGLTFYLIDRAPHLATWRVNSLSKNELDTFPITVNMKYRVADSRRMVEEQINDTESMIARALEPLLRRETRRFGLNHYKQVEAVLEDMLSSTIFANYGLELMELDVLLEISDAELERIKRLEKLERAMRIPQQTEHEATLPTRDSAFKYQAQVTVNYRVTNAELLPTDNLVEAEEWLWRRVRASLRRMSRRFGAEQVLEAELAMQDAVEDEVYSDHGLEITSVQVEIEQDEKALAQAEKLAELRSERTVEEEIAAVEEIRQKREQEKQRRAIDFYAPYIENGEWRLLAMSLANDEMDARAVLDYLDQQQRSQLEAEMRREVERRKEKGEFRKMQWELLQKAMDKDGLSIKTAERFVDDYFEDVSGRVRDVENPALAAPKEETTDNPEEKETKQPNEEAHDEGQS